MGKLIYRYVVLVTHLILLAMMLTNPAITRAAECPKIDHAHGAWNALLQRWVRDGRVAYSAIKQEVGAPLEAYLEELSAACALNYEKWSRNERLAFWINAYNAYTVKLIVDHYPIQSIRTLRADFREPRIHFALVCASVGCPVLSNEAYRAKDLDRQLDEQARLFLSDTSKNRFDPATNTLHLSPIFDWFRADFAAVAGTVVAYVAQYLNDPRISKPDVKIKYTDYDWSLNDLTNAR
jgi:hypothetical protein